MMRKGSALLIVLGMMAFMVISAVAFSMFMRQSRLPSSFLRQRLLSAQLVKAGLAGAMQRLDAAIGDNPYPGVGAAGTRTMRIKTRDGDEKDVEYGNFWQNRVFLESRVAQNGAQSDTEDELLEYDTVSTLTLEALAYLPPALVNTVRYWSTKTSTATWQPLGYDAGRYAFTAVNVSDYFDVNRVRANAMRDSTPENRISLGFLFDDEGRGGGGKAAAFDAFVAAATNDAFRTRLVSLADYNLALHAKGGTPFPSTFCQYVTSPSGDGTFYGGTAADAKRQKFVTDSWFPGIMDGDTEEVYLTDDDNGQPFDGIQQSIDKLTDEGVGNKAFDILRKRLDICTLGALYDYVDEDDIPISLAIPTVERAPMLTGISIEPEGFEVKLAAPAVSQNQVSPQVRETVYTWAIDTLGDDVKIRFSGCGVFPFKHSKSRNGAKTSYDVKVFVRLFLSPDNKFADKTRCDNGVSYCPKDANWTEDLQLMSSGKAWYDLVGSGTATVNASPKTEEEAVFDIREIKLEIPSEALQGVHVYGIKKTETEQPNNQPPLVQYDYCSDQMSKPLLYRDGATVKNVKDAGKNGPKLHLCCACRVRILGDGGQTVDMVPAMVSDDKAYTGHDSAGRAGDNAKLCGEREPFLPTCSAAAVVDLSNNKYQDFVTAASAATPAPAAQPTGVDLGALEIFCEDPRYNWAPEDWYKASGQVSGATWLQSVQTERGTHGSRDIFQFVSDADFLQSMGELQFLPYIRSFRTEATNPYSGGYFNSTKYDGKWHTSGNLANLGYAWQTHWSFGPGSRADRSEGEDADPYYWGISDTNGGTAVSPYADGDLMMAAIANTPYDWYVASGLENLTLDAGREFCFGPESSEARVAWDELKKVAAGIKTLVGTSADWEEALFLSNEANTQWNEEIGPFGANFGDDFHDVDRKFLYSYWRNCFANRQQLFLVFVRAEPSVMGGSSAGYTPGQLGARAVALVWREPESSIADQTQTGGGANTYPHRMRILFYHQFD